MKYNRFYPVTGLFLIALIVCICTPLFAQDPFPGGQGTIEDPWHILTEDCLVTALTIYFDYGNYFIQLADIELDRHHQWFVGLQFAGYYDGDGHKITNLFVSGGYGAYPSLFGSNIGAIVNLHVEGTVSVTDCYGGILVGSNEGYIGQCSTSGTVEGYGNFYNNHPYIGGLVGRNNGVISASYSTANVVMDGYAINSGSGGLVGKNYGGIQNSYATGNVTGVFDGGGFVAWNIGGTIGNCYSIGEVLLLRRDTFSNDDFPDQPDPGHKRQGRSEYVQGFVGWNSDFGYATNSYWDTETSGQTTSAIGEGRTTEQMTYEYAQNTYVNWDFERIWLADGFNPPYNNGYPLFSCYLFAGGSGTAIDPYLVATPLHLHNVRNRRTAYFLQIDDIDLGVAPWNEDGGWVPIGQNNPFIGSFDGNDYSISNLFINRPNGNYQGLFGYVMGRVLGNLVDYDLMNITLRNINVTGRHIIGGLVGSYTGRMKNNSVTGEINGVKDVGGLIGSSHISRVLQCRSSVKVNGIAGYQNHDENIGGLIGYSDRTGVVKCSSTGDIIALESDNVGGLIGHVMSQPPCGTNTLEYNYATGNVHGANNVGGLYGQIVGHGAARIDIYDSYATLGKVQGINMVGGLIGNAFLNVHVRDSYSTGLTEVSDINGIVGGLIGKIHDWCSVRNSFWDIESSGQQTSAGVTGIAHPEFTTHNYKGLTTVKMMMYATHPQNENPYEEWDFVETWAIGEWYNEDPFPSYPYLRWEGEDPQNQVPSEHNRPINFDPYFGEDGREFYVNQNRFLWVSFPWLSRDNPFIQHNPKRQSSTEAIRPLDGKLSFYEHWNVIDAQGGANTAMNRMDWINDLWIGNLDTFCSIRGYKIHFRDAQWVPPGIYRLPTYGTPIDPMTTIPVYEVALGANENWVGVFLPIIDLPYALGPYAEDFFHTIQTQAGTMVWENGQWNQDVTVEYGEMVKLTLLEGVGHLDIQWHDTRSQGRSYTLPENTLKPVARHFPITYGPSFESLFVEDISFDEDIVEIGVYVDGECVGASVFEGKYPTEVLAYTNESHINDNLTVVLYLEDDSYVKYDEFPVRELGSREYSRQTIRPLQSKFSFLKIDRTGGERSLAVEDESKEENVLQPGFGLSQNYPNPFSLGTGVRGQGQTSISLSLPQDMPVSLNIYNIKGQLVRTLISGEANRGEHTVSWNGKDNNNNIVSSGIYFYRLETAGKTINRKMLIVR